MKLIASTLAALALFAAAVIGLLLQALAPAPGEWAVPLRLGPAFWRIERRVGVSALLRIASHPLGLRALDGHRVVSPAGPLQFSAAADGRTLRLRCAPCTIRLPGGGSAASLRLAQADLSLQRQGAGGYHGGLSLGEAARAVHARWSLQLQGEGATLQLSVPDAPLADYYALFADAMPELRRARIDGWAGFDLQLAWPAGELQLQPRLAGVQVSGLGTEALLAARLPAACAGDKAGDAAADLGPWLSRAVIAAEDQRYYEHQGYDLKELARAWQRLPAAAAPRGASTLTQQLAKLLYTGDQRSPLRKLRELLYAVEMERTLGKARILQLYLALAPWGQGRCGAERASRELLGKPPAELSALEAAWLASLLRNPDAALQQQAATGRIQFERIAAIIDGMRPMSRASRQEAISTLVGWSP